MFLPRCPLLSKAVKNKQAFALGTSPNCANKEIIPLRVPHVTFVIIFIVHFHDEKRKYARLFNTAIAKRLFMV